MDYQNQSSLRFSLEESIWFAEGQEVAELYSLSIDPDVTVTEQNQYVVIEGRLQVSGEYRGVETQLISNDDYTDDNKGQEQYVDRVEQREEDDVFLFFHDFPVNISIPTNRVMNREVVEIDISSFDYHMPENRCIKLFAELLITGIYDEDRVSENEESSYEGADVEQSISAHEDHEMEQLSVSLQPKEYESFTAEAFALPRDEDSTMSHQENEDDSVQFNVADLPFNPLQPNFSFSIPTFQRTEDETFGNVPPFDNEEAPVQVNLEESAPIYVEPVNEESMQEVVEGSVSEVVEARSSVEVDDDPAEPTEVEEVQVEPVFEAAPMEEKSKETAPIALNRNELERKVHKPVDEPEKEKEREPAKASVHLTDFFAKKETQARTSLKVCIVQNGDSLSDLATRYSVNKLDIMSYNDLNSENDLHEGQVLYIPKSAVHK